MNILIDIGHPAHVHLFKNAIIKFKENGNTVKITIKENIVIKSLLDALQLDYIILGKRGKGILCSLYREN